MGLKLIFFHYIITCLCFVLLIISPFITRIIYNAPYLAEVFTRGIYPLLLYL